LENRDNPGAFEPAPGLESETPVSAATASGSGVYSVRVNGKTFTVEVAESGQLASVAAASAPATAPAAGAPAGDVVKAVLAGNIFKVLVKAGDSVAQGDPLLVVEAMKMETEIVAPKSGSISEVMVSEGDAVKVGDTLVAIS
ncbi:MAG: biotin/lipoyl-containing protein, partial [Woeseiaceae bacterium]